MRPGAFITVYTPSEIAQAAGIPEARVIAAAGGTDALIEHSDAVRLGRRLRREALGPPPSLFSLITTSGPTRRGGLTLALSGTVHATLIAAVFFITALGLAPSATTLPVEQAPNEKMRLVYLSLPGPGGGGGGGGLLQKTPPPKALREGKRAIASPLPARRPPPAVEPVPKAPEPATPPLQAQALPPIVAPIVASAADAQDRIGILEEARTQKESNGPGTGAGVGTGAGTGLGEGRGSGVGPGSGGGTGGGPFRPGSGIDPPRLLKEIKPDYPDDARRRRLEGSVDLEIVVRRDGSVGDVKILKGLASELNDRAIQAVRQWRFSPAHRQGVPVDVIVEVSVEFKMR
jgi:TonB family protein